MAGQTEYTVEQAAEILSHVHDNLTEGSSFRGFIYGRLGFDTDAYVPLYEAGVMEFTNACPVNVSPDVPPHVSHVGLCTVLAVDGQNITVEFSNQSTKTCQALTGSYQKGDQAIYLYYACYGSGTFKLVPADGNIYSMHEFERGQT